ncbi:hypothetical protein BH10PSE15_BH10PSE15_03840 [soil metagenome]
MIYLLMFVAGALLCNGIPHFVSGVRGERFFTPWSGRGMSSPLQNLLWGSANWVIGLGLVTRTATQNVPHGLIAIVAGFVLAGAGLAMAFERRRAE